MSLCILLHRWRKLGVALLASLSRRMRQYAFRPNYREQVSACVFPSLSTDFHSDAAIFHCLPAYCWLEPWICPLASINSEEKRWRHNLRQGGLIGSAAPGAERVNARLEINRSLIRHSARCHRKRRMRQRAQCFNSTDNWANQSPSRSWGQCFLVSMLSGVSVCRSVR